MLNIKIISTFIAIALTFALSGCADKRIILVPSSQYYPTFPTSDFQPKPTKYPLAVWEQSQDVNGTIKFYLAGDKKDILKYIEDAKQTRSDYNLLLRSINNFNGQIETQNKLQNDKKPQEIE